MNKEQGIKNKEQGMMNVERKENFIVLPSFCSIFITNKEQGMMNVERKEKFIVPLENNEQGTE